jgi:hypothetical protein
MSIYKDEEDVAMTFNISKATSEGLVSGWANVSKNVDGTNTFDWQGDYIPPETLEKAAIGFMLNSRASGVMHMGESKGIVVESIVFTKEKQTALGIPEGSMPEGWFITVKVLDSNVFEKVKTGQLRMFSIQGIAKRTAIDL